jgi:acetylglutamate kinase
MKLVVKLGGSLLEEEGNYLPLLKQTVDMARAGDKILLVHGGGKRMNKQLTRLGIESKFIQGLRVTDQETLEVALMVLAGLVNKQLVMGIGRFGGRAIGICGGDGHSVLARKLELHTEDGPADLGFVGAVVSVDGSFFDALFGSGLLPVVASLAGTGDYQYLNVNADQMAAACAAGIVADELIYLTDVPGVLDRDGNLIRTLSLSEVASLIREGTVSGGMLPKLDACRRALESGVKRVCITGGKAAALARLMVQPDSMQGTLINA